MNFDSLTKHNPKGLVVNINHAQFYNGVDEKRKRGFIGNFCSFCYFVFACIGVAVVIWYILTTFPDIKGHVIDFFFKMVDFITTYVRWFISAIAGIIGRKILRKVFRTMDDDLEEAKEFEEKKKKKRKYYDDMMIQDEGF
eukprot:TRINITY_DN647839_c0_g1_i1.p1 TRINITY_DN647839_c0_g1~~TRINITY_DN647839_c0_g1_i1.p1  ORF type:complete len:140 (-),score=18.55 TRINITY_DN647839_c0_g1_i1:437-856(-)